MGLFKGLFGGFTSAPRQSFYTFHVKCTRCGETIEGRVNLNNDLSADYEGGRTIYFVRKTLMGSGKCFQQIEAELKFNADKQLLEKQAHGGEFVESLVK